MKTKKVNRGGHAATKRVAKRNGAGKHSKNSKKRTLKNGAYSPKVVVKVLTTAQFMAEYRARLKRMPKAKRERLFKKVDEHSAKWLYT